MKRYVCIIITIFISNIIYSQDVSVSASIDKNNYLIGDYIYLRITAEADATTKLFWPAPEEIAVFEIISVNPIDTAKNKDNYKFTQVIVYSVYDAGRYAIPAIRMQYKRTEDEQFNSVLADSIIFTVQTIAVDTTAAIKPVKGIFDVPVKNYLWLYILIGFVVLALIGFGIYFFFLRKKPIAPILHKTTPKSIYDSTIEALNNLEHKKLWQIDETKRYYIELTDIIRSYMESRFGMQAHESTTEEIISQLSRQKISPETVDQVNIILRIGDLAKFAKSKPSGNDNTLALQYAYNFVETTKPEKIEPEK